MPAKPVSEQRLFQQELAVAVEKAAVKRHLNRGLLAELIRNIPHPERLVAQLCFHKIEINGLEPPRQRRQCGMEQAVVIRVADGQRYADPRLLEQLRLFLVQPED